MIVTFKKDTPEAELQRVVHELETAGIRTARSPESRRPILAAVDSVPCEARARLAASPHVD